MSCRNGNTFGARTVTQAIDNHQLKNGEALRDAGGAVIVEQKDLESGALEAFIAGRHNLSASLKCHLRPEWSKPNAMEQVVAVIEEVVHG